jgi:predicted kinase
VIVIMAGLPGTGKSTVARAVAQRTSAIVLDKDIIRAAMFPSTIDYTSEQDDVVVEAMLSAAQYLLRHDAAKIVILDGRPFSRNSQLRHVIDFAEDAPTRWRLIECVCREEVVERRLKSNRSHPAMNRDWNLYQAVKARYEPKPQPKLVVDTDHELSDCVEQVMAYLKD